MSQSSTQSFSVSKMTLCMKWSMQLIREVLTALALHTNTIINGWLGKFEDTAANRKKLSNKTNHLENPVSGGQRTVAIFTTDIKRSPVLLMISLCCFGLLVCLEVLWWLFPLPVFSVCLQKGQHSHQQCRSGCPVNFTTWRNLVLGGQEVIVASFTSEGY